MVVNFVSEGVMSQCAVGPPRCEEMYSVCHGSANLIEISVQRDGI